MTIKNITNQGARGAKMIKVGKCTMGLRESANCDSICPVWKELRLDGEVRADLGREHEAVSRASEKRTV